MLTTCERWRGHWHCYLCNSAAALPPSILGNYPSSVRMTWCCSYAHASTVKDESLTKTILQQQLHAWCSRLHTTPHMTPFIHLPPPDKMCQQHVFLTITSFKGRIFTIFSASQVMNNVSTRFEKAIWSRAKGWKLHRQQTSADKQVLYNLNTMYTSLVRHEQQPQPPRFPPFANWRRWERTW